MHLTRIFAALVGMGMALASPAFAAEPDAWQKASQLGDKAWADVRAGGILAVKPHAADIEQALADEKPIGARAADGDTVYVLTDGMADTVVAMAAAATAKDPAHSKAVAINNPYPLMALLLGSYYDEIGQPADAVRVLDEGLAILDAGRPGMGEHRPHLLIERGEALLALKRFDDALADFDDGLKIDPLEPALKAHLLRGRGFALTELGRLDDAEKAYRDSLVIDPGNETAQHELAYLAKLRAGGTPTAPVLKSVQPQTTTATPH